VTYCTEASNQKSKYAYRKIFFYKKSTDRIVFAFAGIKDLIPQRKNDSYEGFEDLIDRCNVWMKERADIVVINMQSVIVQKNDGMTLS